MQADLKTFAAHGVFGTSALAALTAQNPDEVQSIEALTPGFLEAQLRQVSKFFDLGAVKTGMLFNQELIKATARFLKPLEIPVVIDPVMVSTSGAPLLETDAMQTLVSELLPRATLITPNLDEAASLLETSLETPADLRAGARLLSLRFDTAVLLKGGHLEGEELLDILYLTDGEILEFAAQRVPEVDTHGSGCTLASAIAARLALGEPLQTAVAHAHAYLQAALHQAVHLGPRRFINHFPQWTPLTQEP